MASRQVCRSVLKPHLSTGCFGNMLIVRLPWFWSVRAILFRSQIQNTKDRTTDIEHRALNTGAWASAPATTSGHRRPAAAPVTTGGHRHPASAPVTTSGQQHPFTKLRHIPHVGACLSALRSFITCAISAHLPKVRSFPRLSSAFRRWAQQHRLSRPFALSFRRLLSWQPSPPHPAPVSKTPFPKMFIFS